MFENLQEKLQRAFKTLRGQATLTEENIDEALREIRMALLEADVNFKVVKQLIDQIRAKAVGQEVMTDYSTSGLSLKEHPLKLVRPALAKDRILTAAQIQQQHAKAKAREQALKSEVDALQARLDALPNGQPIGQGETSQVPQPAAPRLQTREGVWFNAGFGLGTLSCIECDGWLNGLSGGLSVGRTMSDRLLLGVGTTGFYRSVLGSGLSAGSVADARLRFYPVRTSGFFITGGMGLGSISIANESEYGLSTVLGLGWDVRVRRNLSLTPFWSGIGVVTSNANASVGQIGLGITVH